MKRSQVLILSLLFVFFISGNVPALSLEHKLVSEKAYFAKGEDKETFTATLKAPTDKTTNPYWLNLYNGYSAKPGFSWVKVELEPLADDPKSGETLADSHTFQRTHAKTIDLTGYFSKGPRKITIEGKGKKGAYFAWTLTTAHPVLQLFKATKITPGQNFVVHGFGFGLDPKKVKITVEDQPGIVMKANNEQLIARAPEKLTGVRVPIRVQVGELLSNELSIVTDYIPPHLVTISPHGGAPGQKITIRGANFSRVPTENTVRFGPHVAKVLNVIDSETMECVIPNLGIGNGSLPLTVTTNGIKSDNYIDFFCGMDMF